MQFWSFLIYDRAFFRHNSPWTGADRILLQVQHPNWDVSRRKDRKNAESARFFISTFLIAARPVLVILRIFMCHEGEGADGRHALFFSAGLLRQMSHSHVPIKNNPAPSRHFLSVCIFNIRRVAVTAWRVFPLLSSRHCAAIRALITACVLLSLCHCWWFWTSRAFGRFVFRGQVCRGCCCVCQARAACCDAGCIAPQKKYECRDGCGRIYA